MTWGHADSIFLHGLHVHARIGCGNDIVSHSLEVDLEVALELYEAAISDALADTTNYADLGRVVVTKISAGSHWSLGAAAIAAADALLAAEKKISQVKLTLRNPRVVFDPPIDQIGATVVRSRPQRAPLGDCC